MHQPLLFTQARFRCGNIKQNSPPNLVATASASVEALFLPNVDSFADYSVACVQIAKPLQVCLTFSHNTNSQTTSFYLSGICHIQTLSKLDLRRLPGAQETGTAEPKDRKSYLVRTYRFKNLHDTPATSGWVTF
jgi:hypothetical protein